MLNPINRSQLAYETKVFGRAALTLTALGLSFFAIAPAALYGCHASPRVWGIVLGKGGALAGSLLLAGGVISCTWCTHRKQLKADDNNAWDR